MSELIYILGAGVNQGIKTENSQISPPLLKSLFRVALNSNPRFQQYDEYLGPVYKYIKKYWNKGKRDLEFGDFDLEECFTLIQLQLIDLNKEKEIDDEKIAELYEVQRTLLAFFMEVLDEFNSHLKYSKSSTFLKLGEIIFNQKATVITFNYDDYIETAIEIASGKNPPHPYLNEFQDNMATEEIDEVCKKSEWRWNRPLGYGIEFDNIQIHDGSKGNYRKFVSKSQFYKSNQLYPWQILKLHGSINWYRYVNQSPNKYLTKDKIDQIYEQRQTEIVLRDLVWSLPISLTPVDNIQLFVEPLIVTPVLYKEMEWDSMSDRIFRSLWKKAKDLLSKCKRIVIIGYSFPSSDFYVKKLILESLCENELDKLIIVNPDKAVRDDINGFVKHKAIETYDNLEDFVVSNH